MANKNNFLLSAQKLWDTVVHDKTFVGKHLLMEQLEQYKKLLNIFQVGDYYYLLFNIVRGEIMDIGRSVTNVLGYEPAELTMPIFMDNIHPDDKAYFLLFEKRITSFYNAIPTEEYPFYKMQYDLRLKTKNNKYKRILIQYLLVDYNERNIYHSFHIHTDISHIKLTGALCFSIIGTEGRPSYYNIQESVLAKSYDLFTRREREILKEIIEGNTSQQIADKLFLSIFTVDTHKKNMLRKAQVHSSLELISKSVKEGWI
ncbi:MULTISPECIES: LuxR C-terminal-related transcriptional regulator [Chitinophagaceae]